MNATGPGGIHFLETYFFVIKVHRMINFLRKRGYTVLNLIEIRKPYEGENLTQTIRVGEHEFDY